MFGIFTQLEFHQILVVRKLHSLGTNHHQLLDDRFNHFDMIREQECARQTDEWSNTGYQSTLHLAPSVGHSTDTNNPPASILMAVFQWNQV